MVTSTHRWISDPSLAFLPTQAWSGGRRLRPLLRRPLLGARGERHRSRVEGDREAIHALQTNPVHYYQRPDATPPRGGRERHVALRPRRVGALRDLGQGPLPRHRPTSTGTRRASSSTTSATCARPTSRPTRCSWAGRSRGRRASSASTRSRARGRTSGTSAGCTRSRRRPPRRNATFQNKWGVTGRVAYDQLVDTAPCSAGPRCGRATSGRRSSGSAATTRAACPSPSRASTTGRSRATPSATSLSVEASTCVPPAG